MRLLYWALGLSLLGAGCRGRMPAPPVSSAKTASLDPNAQADVLTDEALETDGRVPAVRDIYRQAALVVRSQIESSSVEERLHALATLIERETKEIP